MKVSNIVLVSLLAAVMPAISKAESLVAPASATVVATEQEAAKFPDPKSTYVDAVQRYDIGQIKKLDMGLNKNQVRFLMGNPHFSEGLFFVHTWDYLVGLQKPNSNEYQLCQLRVGFDKHYLVNSLKWRDQSCQDLMAPPAVVAASTAEPKQSYSSNSILFNFDKSAANQIVGGEAVIDSVAQELSSKFKHIQYLTVTGYADRIGQNDYNQSLSLARAQTVANALVSKGLVNADQISVQAKGATSTFMSCLGKGVSQQVIQCLQPNRRAIVTATGE